MMDHTAAIGLAARIFLVGMFPPSALEKIWHWNNAVAQTRSGGPPALLVVPMLLAAIAVEGITPLMIVLRLWDRPAAALLALFCVVSAFLYHPFWKGPDFFSPRDDSVAREHFWQFLKNFGLTGGLMFVIFGSGGL